MKEIYDCTRSFALSASAGSGKTFALTTRLLAMLLAGVHPAEILAITFTNAAANDIRKKLFDRLLLLESGEARELALFGGIGGVEPGRIHEKAKALRPRLVRHFSALQISTIHSFFARVLRSFPGETGFFGDLGVLDEWAAGRFLTGAFERFFGLLPGDGPLFERVAAFLKAFRENSLNAGGAVREAYGRIRGRYYTLADLLGMIEKHGDVWGAFLETGGAVFGGGLDGAIEFLAGCAQRFIKGRGPERRPSREVASFLRGLVSFLESRRIGVLIGLPALRSDLRYIGWIRDFLPGDESRRFIETLGSVRRELARYLETQMRAYAGTYVEIYRRVDRFYGESKAAANTVDFTDIELHARDFFSRVTDFNYFDYRLGSGITHVLIDEFQDTSTLQWDALAPIVSHSLARGGTLFYVGDVKQSIYRWRGGEPELFERVSAGLGVERRRLGASYRQNGVLLEFVNTLFEAVSRGRVAGYVYARQHLPEEKGGADRGYVSIRERAEREGVLDGIAEGLRELEANGVVLGDCAVLCRTNMEIEAVERKLLEQGIGFSSPGRSRLLADCAVLDAVGVLKLALRPDERLYAASLLRSPVFNYSFGEVEEYLDATALGTRAGGASAEVTKTLVEKVPWLSPSRALRLIYEELGLFDVYPGRREALFELLEKASDFERTVRGGRIADFLEFLEQSAEELTVRLMQSEGVKLLTIHAAKGLEFHSVILPFLSQPFRLTMDGSLLFQKDGSGRIEQYCLARADYRDHLAGEEGYARLFEDAESKEQVDELNALYVAVTRAKENLFILPLVKGRARTVGTVLLEALGPGWGREARGPAPVGEPRMGVSAEEAHEEGGAAAVSEGRDRSIGSPVPCRASDGKGAGAVTRVETRYGPTRPFSGEALEMLAAGRVREEAEGARGSAGEAGGGFSSSARERRVELLKGLVVHKALEMIGDVASVPVRTDEDLDLLLRKAMAQVGGRSTRGERERAFGEALASLRNALADDRIANFFWSGALREVVSLSRTYANGVGRIDRVLVGEAVEVVDFKTDTVRGTQRLNELTRLYRGQVGSYCRSLEIVYPGRAVRGILYFTDAPYGGRIAEVFSGGAQ